MPSSSAEPHALTANVSSPGSGPLSTRTTATVALVIRIPTAFEKSVRSSELRWPMNSVALRAP
jgi:hypothetical protein